MSNYFSKKNDKEVGPGPERAIEWLIVQNPGNVAGVTQCLVVRTTSAYLAWEEAAKVFTDFRKADCQAFPNPRLIL